MAKDETNNTRYTDEYVFSEYTKRVEPRLDEIEMWVFEGWTFGQIAKELGVPNSLLWRMRRTKSFTGLREVFKLQDLMTENVENALYKKATGYWVPEQHVIKVKREYYNKNDRRCTQEDVKIVETKRFVEPDFSAQRFYLLNHAEDRYHAENKEPKDYALEQSLNSMDNILVKIREVAVNASPTDDEE